jgi:hypothetical protein
MNLSEKALNKKQVHSMRCTCFFFYYLYKELNFTSNAFEMQKVHAEIRTHIGINGKIFTVSNLSGFFQFISGFSIFIGHYQIFHTKNSRSQPF